VEGGPGTGKSYILLALTALYGKRVQCTAFTGVAASCIHGATLHSVFPLGSSDARDGGEVRGNVAATMALMAKRFDGVDVLVIDEHSFVGALDWSDVDRALRKMRSKDRAFGGMSVIMLGDSRQLPCCFGSAIASAVLGVGKAKGALDAVHGGDTANLTGEGTQYAECIQLMRSFKRITLTENMRSGGDELSELVAELRAASCLPRGWETRRGKYRVGGITEATARKIKEKLKFRPGDRVEDWWDATIAVSSRPEAAAINLEMDKLYGKRVGQPVVLWPYMKEQWNYQHEPGKLESLLTMTPDCVGMFVKGARGMLSRNIAVAYGVCNSSAVKMCGMVFADDVRVDVDARIAAAEPGEVVELEWAPVALLVKLMDETAQARLEHHEGMTLAHTGTEYDGCFPVMCEKSFAKTSIGGTRTQFARIECIMSFAVTYHKLQGLTVDKLIIVLRSWIGELGQYSRLKALVYSALYVAVSRVRHIADLRVAAMRERDVTGLVGLCSPAHNMAIEHCYDDDGMFELGRIAAAMKAANLLHDAAERSRNAALRKLRPSATRVL